jgi:hypothetical protein
MIKYNSKVLGLGLVSMVAGLWLVYWSPDSLHAFIRYGMGSALSAIGGSYAIIHLTLRGQTGLERHASSAELSAWLSMSFVAAITAYLLVNLPFLATAPPLREWSELGARLMWVLLFWGALAIVMRVRRGPAAVVEDERDRAIAARAERWARGALTFCLIGLWVMLWFSPDRRLQWATPKMLACVIFFMLLSASLARNAVAAAMYWRDRR